MHIMKINICIPIIFNNPLKACFPNKKYILQSKHTRHKFLNKKQFLADF